MGWVWAVRAGEAEVERERGRGGREGEGGVVVGPGIGAHLAISLAVLLIPLLLSGELASASASGHLAFLSSPGFWAQELALALSGLASLAAFWSLASTLSPLSCLAVVALKDFLLPSFYAFALGNSLDAGEKGAVLTRTQQWVGLGLLGAWAVAEVVVEAGAPAGVGRKEAGREKEG